MGIDHEYNKTILLFGRVTVVPGTATQTVTDATVVTDAGRNYHIYMEHMFFFANDLISICLRVFATMLLCTEYNIDTVSL